MPERHRRRWNIGGHVSKQGISHLLSHPIGGFGLLVLTRPHAKWSNADLIWYSASPMGIATSWGEEFNPHCCSKLRIHDDFVGFSSGISRNAVFDFLDVLRCPCKFELSGVDVAYHAGYPQAIMSHEVRISIFHQIRVSGI